MSFLHLANILGDTCSVFLNIAHLVHHFCQIGVVRIRAMFSHQVGFSQLDRQRSRIAHHNTVTEDGDLHTSFAVVVAMGHSIHDGLEDNRARNLKFDFILSFLVALTKTNRKL